MPPLSPSDLDAISRTVEKIVDRKLESRLGPVEKRIEKHSGQYRELGPEVARKISESQHDIEDARLGFERFMMNAVGRVEAKADAIAKSIPPAASAANGAEAAAVAGAKAAVRVEGKTDAVQVAANRADTQSLAAKVGAHRALLAQILTAVALALWQLYEHVVRAGAP